MKTILFKSFLLFISIPLFNSVAFGIGALVHEMHISTITAAQYTTYQNAMAFMILTMGVAIVALETLYHLGKINNRLATVLYVFSFLIIALGTVNQFMFRPLEHSLTFLSITTVLASRYLLNKRMFSARKAKLSYC